MEQERYMAAREVRPGDHVVENGSPYLVVHVFYDRPARVRRHYDVTIEFAGGEPGSEGWGAVYQAVEPLSVRPSGWSRAQRRAFVRHQLTVEDDGARHARWELVE